MVESTTYVLQEPCDPMHKGIQQTRHDAREHNMNRSRHDAKSPSIEDSKKPPTTWTSKRFKDHTTQKFDSESKGML